MRESCVNSIRHMSENCTLIRPTQSHVFSLPILTHWPSHRPVPCTVPYTEHGTYVAGSEHPEASRHAANTKLLAAYEEIYNGDVIDFQCDAGFNILGANQLKCWHGNWDVNTLPECTAAPCTLPTIVNAVYQGGYRGGLTIAHDSSVTIHCENPANNLPVQMGE